MLVKDMCVKSGGAGISIDYGRLLVASFHWLYHAQEM